MTAAPTATRAGIDPGYQGRDPATAAAAGLLSWAEASERLAAAKNYWVVTAAADGRPCPRPLWGLWIDDSLIFTVLRSTRTARNLAANPYASVHLESTEQVLIMEGVVTETDPGQLAAFFEAWLEKYAAEGAGASDPGTLDRVVYRLRPRQVHAWTLGRFPGDATRWTFADA